MLPSTERRVSDHTAQSSNARIHAEMMQRIESLMNAPQSILTDRLCQLDREWDIERVLEANAATIALAGTILAATVHRKWLVLPAVVTGFLLQHALQGWCPPLPLFRKLGVRTAGEIAREKYAIKHLRGDFDTFCAAPRAEKMATLATSLQEEEM